MGKCSSHLETNFSPSLAQFSRSKQDIFYPNFFHKSCNSMILFSVEIVIISFGSL